MNVLITGISGLLGSEVAKEANKSGHNVIGLCRNKSKLKFNFPIRIEELDLTKSPIMKDLLQNVDIVIHCAANTSMKDFDNHLQDKTNIESTGSLIEMGVDANIKRFILISSANTLVPGDVNNPGSEARKMETSASNLNYINSKINAEILLVDAVRKKGLNGIIINPTFILNPFANNQSSNQLLEYGLKKSILFYPKGGKNIVDVRDVSRAILKAINKGNPGENYILSNQNFTYKEFYKLVLSAQNRKAMMIPIPSWLMQTLGGFSTATGRLLGIPFNLNSKTSKLLNSNHYYERSKATKHLDYNPRPITDTIKCKLEHISS